jgi:hypothetical protein
MDWLNERFPKVQTVDVECTMLRYEFPPEVCEIIRTTWTKVSEENGGTYRKPMEQLNSTAMHIARTKGWDQAAKHMMESSGMDYSRMRMNYG